MSFDLISCFLSCWIAFGLRLDQWGMLQGNQWLVPIFSICFFSPLFVSFGLYRAIFRYIGSSAISSIVKAFSFYTILFFGVFSLYGVSNIPRAIGVIQPILFFIIVGASRYFVRDWLLAVTFKKKQFTNLNSAALIYGAGSAGRQLASVLAANKELLVIGFVDDDLRLQGNTINGLPVYPSDNLPQLIKKFEIANVLLAIPSASQTRRNEIIFALYGCGVRVRTLPGLLDLAAGRVKVSDLHDLDMNDLLGRKVVPPDLMLLAANITDKNIIVTGAGGSIGSELCRQIIRFSPKTLILVDNSEYALYAIHEELKKIIKEHEGNVCVSLEPFLVSVRDKESLRYIFSQHCPDVVFHAAAYKHVPLVERNPEEGIGNNVDGTLTCAQLSLEFKVQNFILISTDKAVRPTNIMGASKRISELVLQALADEATKKGLLIKFSMVRFGNVLGSSGSVAPLFINQIKGGGPITLTHYEVTRYFMTIPEAAQLVIQSSAMAHGGDVFVLDMGKPVRIYDLALRMIHLSGLMIKDELNPNGDIEIVVTGMRDGEKLYEELLIGDNPQPTGHPKIMKAHENFLPMDQLLVQLENLKSAQKTHDIQKIRAVLREIVPEYHPSSTLD